MAAVQAVTPPGEFQTPGWINDILAWATGSVDPLWWAAIAAGVFTLLIFLSGLTRSILRRLGARETGSIFSLISDLIRKIGSTFLAIVSLQIATWSVDTPTALDQIIDTLFTISVVIQGTSLTYHLITELLRRYVKQRPEHTRDLRNAMGLITILIRIILVAIALLLILENLGVDVTALVAGFGIGGVAIGLAAQGIFKDLFSSLSIILDKPFETGDFIVLGDMMGTVERIGLQTTRVRSLSGEQLVIANSDLVSTRVRNYKRMIERRVTFSLGIAYETPHRSLETVPALVKAAVEAQEHTRFDRCHFARYGDFALIFETVYHVLSADYTTYMDIQQAVNMRIFKDFESAGVRFAYPTQTIHVASAPMAPLQDMSTGNAP